MFRINDLPPELQRQIFQSAARSRTDSALALLLVAKKINIWILPMVYRMVTLGIHDAPLFLRTMDTIPHSFFAIHVKKLCLTVAVPIQTATRILQTCIGVESLACWIDVRSRVTSVAPLIISLSLTRLSIEINHFTGLLNHSTTASTWFSGLTHLEIIYHFGPLTQLNGLAAFPSLSHVRLKGPLSFPEQYLAKVISQCQYLDILVVIVDDFSEEEEVELDPRVIFMPCPEVVVYDWEAGFRGLPDTWSQAEAGVKKQIALAQSRIKSGRDIPECL
ncbi:hypothetical protein C8J56DRAFT_334103 [Mycena floridula]|nr:hypothetical protein C8J56DRAFT_334103 [Mycena floridula]